MNRLTLIGRIGQDIETKIANNGVSISKLTIATSETYKDKNGEKQTNTEWHNVVAFGKLSEILSKYFKKGDLIFIEGKVTYKSYEKDGAKKYYTEIIASNFEFIGGNKNNNQSESSSPQSNQNNNEQQHQPDGLPF